jgi:hypothetical protein
MVAPIQSGMSGLYSSKTDLYNLKRYENVRTTRYRNVLLKIRKEMSEWIAAHLFCNLYEMLFYGFTTGSSSTLGVQDKKPAELNTHPSLSLPATLILSH